MFENFSRDSFETSGRKGLCPEAECQGKTKYLSKADAIRRIKHQGKKRGYKRRAVCRKGMLLVPYRCPHCAAWHVGSTLPRRLK